MTHVPKPSGSGSVEDHEHTRDSARTAELEQVRAAIEGDAQAFQMLYARYRGAVRAVVVSHVGWTDVEDLTQDVFLAAWQRLEQLRDPGGFGPWLLQSARNRCRDHHRRRKPVAPMSLRHEPQTDMPPRPEALEVLAAISQLSPSYRETLVMRFVEGMSGAEIAARTGLTLRSVRVNLHRGTKKLREALGEHAQPGQGVAQ